MRILNINITHTTPSRFPPCIHSLRSTNCKTHLSATICSWQIHIHMHMYFIWINFLNQSAQSPLISSLSPPPLFCVLWRHALSAVKYFELVLLRVFACCLLTVAIASWKSQAAHTQNAMHKKSLFAMSCFIGCSWIANQ